MSAVARLTGAAVRIYTFLEYEVGVTAHMPGAVLAQTFARRSDRRYVIVQVGSLLILWEKPLGGKGGDVYDVE